MEITYKISDTQLTAQWIKTHSWKPYHCSNCITDYENIPYQSYKLPFFCPNCGARMLNPKYIHYQNDYIDND
jgi:DNA-directed RNA polymerase subunit RPC12/RpoP